MGTNLVNGGGRTQIQVCLFSKSVLEGEASNSHRSSIIIGYLGGVRCQCGTIKSLSKQGDLKSRAALIYFKARGIIFLIGY